MTARPHDPVTGDPIPVLPDPMRGEREGAYTVLRRHTGDAPAPAHVCRLPGAIARLIQGLSRGARVRCNTCKHVWEWNLFGEPGMPITRYHPQRLRWKDVTEEANKRA